MTRAALYARVSSAAQRDAQTIDGQLRQLRAFIAAERWTPAGEYIDDGRSASTGKLDKREAFARLLRDAEARAFDVLVVFDIDRLTRTTDMLERAQVLGPFQRLGIDIVTPTGARHDLRTMLGSLWTTIKAEVAAEETKVRIARSLAGRERGLSLNRKPQGVTPYGLVYSRHTHEWEIDSERAAVAREILARILQGESCMEIAADLEVRGAPAMRAGWHRRAVWRIATSEHLTGRWLAHRATRTFIDVPAITSSETFARVQAALSVAKTRGLRKTKHVYLLEGLAVCGECGGPMGIRSARPNKGYMRAAAYVCRSRLAREYRQAERCTSPCLPLDSTDAEVWATVREALRSPALADRVRQRLEEREANRKDWQADAKRYEARLAKAERAGAVILERFRRGLISEAALDVELGRLAKERDSVRAQLATAERALSGASVTRERLDDAMRVLDDLRCVLGETDFKTRRELVKLLVPRGGVAFVGERLRVTMLIPRGSRRGHVGGPDSSESHETHLRLRVVARRVG